MYCFLFLVRKMKRDFIKFILILSKTPMQVNDIYLLRHEIKQEFTRVFELQEHQTIKILNYVSQIVITEEQK